jgi:hypothetical protein
MLMLALRIAITWTAFSLLCLALEAITREVLPKDSRRLRAIATLSRADLRGGTSMGLAHARLRRVVVGANNAAAGIRALLH